MRSLLLFLFILISSSSLWAQDSTIVVIKAGTSVRDVLTTADIFLNPQFMRGKVFYKNGLIAAAPMNYNSLYDQMLFIDSKGDTLALSDEKTISLIALDKDTFYYFNGYIRLVASNSVVKLAEKKNWQLADVRKMGSHNRPANTYAVTSMHSMTDVFGRTFDLILDGDVLLRKKPEYYFGDMYNSFVAASKKNLLSFFSKKEDMLAKYLKENKVNFNKENDLEKVTQFLGQNY